MDFLRNGDRKDIEDDLLRLIAMSYVAARRTVNRKLDQAGIPLSASQASVVLLLAKSGILLGSEIARQLGFDQGMMSRIVDDLVCRGFISREHDPRDRRIRKLQLTNAGLELVSRLSAPLTGAHATLSRALNQHDRRRLCELLRRLVQENQDASS